MYIYLQIALQVEPSLPLVEVDAVLPKEEVAKVPLQNKKVFVKFN
jgi:hypothetical protein